MKIKKAEKLKREKGSQPLNGYHLVDQNKTMERTIENHRGSSSIIYLSHGYEMTPFIKDSRESNSNLEEHKDNLENHDVSDSKHFPFSSNIMLCDFVSNRVWSKNSYHEEASNY